MSGCWCVCSILVILIITCIITVLSTKYDAGDTFETNLVNAEKRITNEIHEDIAKLGSEMSQWSANACVCEDFSCGCCTHWQVDLIHLNSTICINMTYLAKDYGLSFTMTVDKYTLYNETISARSPPPICFGSPFVKDLADVCLRFYNLDADLHHLHGCCKVEARLKHLHIAEYNFGCFDLGPKQEQNEIMPEVILLA